MARAITEEEKQYAQELLARARSAQKQIDHLSQAEVDRAIQAVAWAAANEKTFTRLARMGVEESGGEQGGAASRGRWSGHFFFN